MPRLLFLLSLVPFSIRAKIFSVDLTAKLQALEERKKSCITALLEQIAT